MNRTIVLVALLLAPLSGCLGIPDGAIAPGDSVQAVVTVRDADSGAVLMQDRPLDFVVGQGNADLGFEFERRLVGTADDFDGTLTVRDDPSLQWRGTVDVQAYYESDLVQTIPLQQFTPSFGQPEVGDVFSPQFSFFDYLVLDVDETTVTFRPIPEQGQQDPVPHIGAILVTRVEGDQLVQVLEPDEGATFRVLPPNPFNPNTPLGLAPGSYRTVGGDGQTITYQHSAGTNPDLVGRDLEIHVSIRSVSPAPGGSGGAEPVDGNYGVRQSAYVNGAPSSQADFGPLSGATAESGDDHDDGHDH